MKEEKQVSGSGVYKTWLVLVVVAFGLMGLAFPPAWGVAAVAALMLVLA